MGSFQFLYKGPDLLVEALELCASRDLAFRLRFVGAGRYVEELRQKARRNGLQDRVQFVGQVPSAEAVRAVLDEADLFVLPSRSEGLPRAMIEAMARGLPCIGAKVGGIPELLAPEDLVRVNDVNDLAGKISEVLRSPRRLAQMSARNLDRARSYHEDVLRERRNRYYTHLRETTERWLCKHVS